MTPPGWAATGDTYFCSSLLLPLEDVAAEHQALKKAFCSASLCLGLKCEVLRWCHLLGLGEKFWYRLCAFEQRLV